MPAMILGRVGDPLEQVVLPADLRADLFEGAAVPVA